MSYSNTLTAIDSYTLAVGGHTFTGIFPLRKKIMVVEYLWH